MSQPQTENKNVTIITHSSGFHTDDIFGVATLLLVLKDQDVSITRSRNKEIIEKGDYVLDVGSVYDPEKNRFDHHQEGGAGVRENGIPYASFGLIWKKFGESLCGSKEVSSRIDQMIVQPIDSNDNGIEFVETILADLHPFDIGFITHIFQPTWKENDQNIDGIFIKLTSYAKVLLERIIKSTSDAFEAENLVMDVYNNSLDKRLIILDNVKYPWGSVLSKLPEPIYVIYKNITDDTWSVKGVRSNLFSYESRKNLPESWAGKSNGELDKITGVEGCVFCHRARFMAVNRTKEGILKMAEIALAA